MEYCVGLDKAINHWRKKIIGVFLLRIPFNCRQRQLRRGDRATGLSSSASTWRRYILWYACTAVHLKIAKECTRENICDGYRRVFPIEFFSKFGVGEGVGCLKQMSDLRSIKNVCVETTFWDMKLPVRERNQFWATDLRPLPEVPASRALLLAQRVPVLHDRLRQGLAQAGGGRHPHVTGLWRYTCVHTRYTWVHTRHACVKRASYMRHTIVTYASHTRHELL
jgi:hypothetical protein